MPTKNPAVPTKQRGICGDGGNLLEVRNHAGQECVLRILYFVGSG